MSLLVVQLFRSCASVRTFFEDGVSVEATCPHKAATPENTHSSDHRVFGFKARKTFGGFFVSRCPTSGEEVGSREGSRLPLSAILIYGPVSVSAAAASSRRSGGMPSGLNSSSSAGMMEAVKPEQKQVIIGPNRRRQRDVEASRRR